MIGISFGDCAGWLHRGNGDLGVVICPAQGFEELCSRRTLAVLGHKLADAGITVLRFDYPGTADSLGDHDDPDRLAAWRGSINAAIALLREEAGITRIVPVGLRLGATLAAFAAENNDDVIASVLLAPVLSGRVYVREMQALQRFIRPMHYPAGLELDVADGIKIGGFVMTPDTIEDLKRLDLMALERIPAGVLMLPRPATVANDKLKAHLDTIAASSAHHVEIRAFAGYDRMMCDPTASTVPEADLDAVTAWIADLSAATALTAPDRSPQPSPQPSGVATPQWREQGLTFGQDDHLVGVLCEPTTPRDGKPALLFLNSGMDYHAGWARMTVQHARALAEQGVASLRIDVSGIGDSRNARDQAVDAIYRAQALSDARCAVELLIARGYPPPTLTGGCSGAYTAFHLLREDQRLSRAVIRNLQVFQWTPEIGYKVQAGLAAHPFEATAKRRSNDPDAPRMAVMRSQLEGYVMRATRRLSSVRAGIVDTLARVMPRLQGGGEAQDVVGWFRDLSRRGATVTLVFSDGDPGLDELARHTGPGGEKIRSLAGVSIRVIPNADHNLTPHPARKALLDILSQAVG